MFTSHSIYSTPQNIAVRWFIGTVLALSPLLAGAFDSGSTGADGDFNPTVNTELPLPPDGILNFKSINIPQSVTVTFKRNAANTPVYLLVQQDATIAGTIDVSGHNSTDTGVTGHLDDEGYPGQGGPGGFDGGIGGWPNFPVNPNSKSGGNGLGPGGGTGGWFQTSNTNCLLEIGLGGGGGGYGGNGGTGSGRPYGRECYPGFVPKVPGGNVYGNDQLQPLIGGSGGGGAGGENYFFRGVGGSGGGGAILLAASGTVNIPGGHILANGGVSGKNVTSTSISGGGVGSGGAIRIVASVMRGGGDIQANGGYSNNNYYGGGGSSGRVRLEAETNFYYSTPSPNGPNTFASPGPVFLPNRPGLAFASVAGVAVTGNPNISIPATTRNPVNVVVSATGVPVGSNVTLGIKPETGGATPATPVALVGTLSASTATFSVNLPDGASIFEASTSYTVTASIGDALAPYANNERVEKVTLTASTGKSGVAILTTISGKTYHVSQTVLPKS